MNIDYYNYKLYLANISILLVYIKHSYQNAQTNTNNILLNGREHIILKKLNKKCLLNDMSRKI